MYLGNPLLSRTAFLAVRVDQADGGVGMEETIQVLATARAGAHLIRVRPMQPPDRHSAITGELSSHLAQRMAIPF